MASWNRSAYGARLRDPRWQKLRLEIMQRDEFKCRQCGASDKTLNAHHSYYDFGADPWEYAPDSIITLCEECHEGEHANWVCGAINEALCSNGFWSVYDRDFLGAAIRGTRDDRALTQFEAWRVVIVVEALCASMRGDGSIAKTMEDAASLFASDLPFRRSRDGASSQP